MNTNEQDSMDDTQKESEINHEAVDACAKCAEYLDGWKRAQADYQNLKKHTEKEREDFRKYANERLLSDLISVLDQFNLAMKFMPAIDALPEAEQKNWKNWRVGVEAVKMKWDELATTHHLSEVPTSGLFEPRLHEAVEEREDTSAEPGAIIEVIETGWKLHDRLIRPAKVIIASGASEDQPDAIGDSEAPI